MGRRAGGGGGGGEPLFAPRMHYWVTLINNEKNVYLGALDINMLHVFRTLDNVFNDIELDVECAKTCVARYIYRTPNFSAIQHPPLYLS